MYSNHEDWRKKLMIVTPYGRSVVSASNMNARYLGRGPHNMMGSFDMQEMMEPHMYDSSMGFFGYPNVAGQQMMPNVSQQFQQNPIYGVLPGHIPSNFPPSNPAPFKSIIGNQQHSRTPSAFVPLSDQECTSSMSDPYTFSPIVLKDSQSGSTEKDPRIAKKVKEFRDHLKQTRPPLELVTDVETDASRDIRSSLSNRIGSPTRVISAHMTLCSPTRSPLLNGEEYVSRHSVQSNANRALSPKHRSGSPHSRAVNRMISPPVLSSINYRPSSVHSTVDNTYTDMNRNDITKRPFSQNDEAGLRSQMHDNGYNQHSAYNTKRTPKTPPPTKIQPHETARSPETQEKQRKTMRSVKKASKIRIRSRSDVSEKPSKISEAAALFEEEQQYIRQKQIANRNTLRPATSTELLDKLQDTEYRRPPLPFRDDKDSFTTKLKRTQSGSSLDYQSRLGLHEKDIALEGMHHKIYHKQKHQTNLITSSLISKSQPYLAQELIDYDRSQRGHNYSPIPSPQSNISK